MECWLWLRFCHLARGAAMLSMIPNLQPFEDGTGSVATFNTAGDIHKDNPFFQSLGTNGRTCETCHQADQAFSLSAKGVQKLYDKSHGKDPLFAAFDGANCPTATSTGRDAHSLLLDRGLIRIGITLPATPEFQIALVHDPYGCAMTTDVTTGRPLISVYRRPLPTANLRYSSAIMFDGRETLMPLNNAQTIGANMNFDLADQAKSAVLQHAQGVAPSDAQLAQIVQFEMGLTTAQVRDNAAGSLDKHGAMGGAMALSNQGYYPGANDALERTRRALRSIRARSRCIQPGKSRVRTGIRYDGREEWDDHGRNAAREDIAAGEKLFNTRTAVITGVRGLNDNPALGSPVSIAGTCTTCHDSPNVGNHSVALPLDIATSRLPGYEANNAIMAGLQQLSAPDLPVFAISGCVDAANPGNPATIYTTDPGKGLVSGKCADVNRGRGRFCGGWRRGHRIFTTARLRICGSW